MQATGLCPVYVRRGRGDPGAGEPKGGRPDGPELLKVSADGG